jgi:hypothetical protein
MVRHKNRYLVVQVSGPGRAGLSERALFGEAACRAHH